MNAALLRWRDPQRGGVEGGGVGGLWRRDWGGNVGNGKRSCLGNHIAEPVPERYRFTFATIPALLMKTEPRGDGRGGREGDEGEGESHTCRVLLEMKGAFELEDGNNSAEHMKKCTCAKTLTSLWYCFSLLTCYWRTLCMSDLLKRAENLIYTHTHLTHWTIWWGDDRRP